MAFDPNLDEKIFEETIEGESSNVKVGVFSYNDGPKKLQLSRERVNASGDKSFAKLGRMTKEEVEKTLPVIQKALEKM